MEVIHEYPQQFFSVGKFLELVDHDFANDEHDAEACTLDIDGGYYSNRVVYRLLRNDVLIFDQDVLCREAEHSTVSANPEGQFYLFKYVHAQNLPLEIRSNGVATTVETGFFGFCNNHGNHEIIHPAGFMGRYLQVLVEHSFLDDFVNLGPFEQSVLHDVLFGQCGDMFTMPAVHNTLRRRLDKLVRLVRQPPGKPFDKLRMLGAIAELLEVFFEIHIAESKVEVPTGSPRHEAAVDSAASYLADNLGQPFPGLPYLSRPAVGLPPSYTGFQCCAGRTLFAHRPIGHQPSGHQPPYSAHQFQQRGCFR